MERSEGPSRLEEFKNAPESVQAAFFAVLAKQQKDEREFKVWLANTESDDPVAPFQPKGRLPHEPLEWNPMWSRRARAVERIGASFDGHPDKDDFAAIPASEYVPALTGQEAEGRMVRCPLPDHQDDNPSCGINGRLWNCHSCGRGGNIFTLAGALWGIDHRGSGFDEICQRLAELLV